ncbi:hypothetical protein [Nocardioides zeae]|uniref:Uncharacterized protein n=1 Tax=Nocardioides zeae TaxID=1457234 RepID=A0AAJ1X4E2_9ACTN|nr:hypothetical protein [Nocardioides zeae]MDQ1106749.1 hypothetical protein [Nocardioides zeae]
MRKYSVASLRIADQAAWSLAFFAFNAQCLSALRADQFAGLATATALGFIGVAISRSATLQADIISGTKQHVLSTEAVMVRSGLKVNALLGLAVGGCAWLATSRLGDIGFVFAFLAAGLVLADSPRQILVIEGRYVWSLFLAVGHAILAGFGVLFFQDDPSVWWLIVLCLLCWGGWMIVALTRVPHLRERAPATVGLRLSLGLEACYFGLAGQVGLFALYFADVSDATVALRVSYALVFSPVFSLLQGLVPLIVRELNERMVQRRVGDVRRLLRRVSASVFFLSLLAGGLGCIVVPRFWAVDSNLFLAFLPVVGLSLVAAQVLELYVTSIRMLEVSKGLHAERTALAAGDIVLQLASVLIMGPLGLVSAIGVGALVRLLLVMRYGRRMRKR